MRIERETIDVIIMTLSSKFGNKCVAGINPNTGEWIRLVSNNQTIHGALSNENLKYDNGGKCNILDIVTVPILRYDQNRIQPENVIIDTKSHLKFKGKATLKEVLSIHPPENEYRTTILGNEYMYVEEMRIANVGYSLILVEVTDLKIIHKENPEGKQKTKAYFRYNGREYRDISITDPDYYNKPENIVHKKALLVMSIGTPYNGHYYKFIAKIFTEIS